MINHPAFPVDAWHIRQTSFDPDLVAQAETLFATANGYLGLRGNLEEATPVFERGTYLNGFFESRPYIYPEGAYGFARDAQTMANVTDGKILRLTIDGEPLDLSTGTVLEHDRVLDLRRGYAGRELVWESPSGRRLSLRTRRLVSFVHRHIACIDYEVMVLDGAATVEISSELVANESDRIATDDPREVAGYWGQVLRPVWTHADGLTLGFGHDVERAQLATYCAAGHTVVTDNEWTSTVVTDDDSSLAVRFTVTAQPGEPFNVVKHLVYDHGPVDDAPRMQGNILALLDDAISRPMTELLATQMTYLDRFWADCHVEVIGDDAMQQAVRFALFQILQASACAEGHGIAAKGLTGQGYGGHYFWDMETYVVAALTHLAPDAAASALRFRHATLDAARGRAAELSLPGALYPWRTIDGTEASAFFPAGTAEYHLTADVAMAMSNYVHLAGDQRFLIDHAAEVLVETARMWAARGFFDPSRNGAFCIHGVTGPDEYTAIVNNNTFTNLAAAANLSAAVEALEFLAGHHPTTHARLVHDLAVTTDEVAVWQRAADAIYLHVDPATGVHGQDDTFCTLQDWPVAVADIPADLRPLLLHFHPLDLYRRKVIKQADLVMAMFLHPHAFTPEQKAANFAYYEPLTTADSSLSRCVQAIIAAEVGDTDLAWRYTRESALTDLDDVQHNVGDGIHIAAQAGTWLALACGFGGLRRSGVQLSFAPCLPDDLDGLRIRMHYRHRVVEIAIEHGATTYTLLRGDTMELLHRGSPVVVTTGTPVRIED